MKKKILCLCMLLFAAIFAVSCGENSSTDETEKTTPAVQQEEQSGQEGQSVQEEQPIVSEDTAFAVGDRAMLDGVAVTLNSVTESEGSMFNTPTDGNVFVLCEFTIENETSEELNISSILCFDAYCDGYTCSYSFGAQLAAEGKSGLDGSIISGKKMNGVIGFEVSKEWGELEIHFSPDVWNDDEIVFTAKR